MESLLQRSFSAAVPVKIPMKPTRDRSCSVYFTFSGEKNPGALKSCTASMAPGETRIRGGDRRRMRCYYEDMIKLEPTNALILSNYGKYLHEVEGDLVKAEHYYGKAILASPGDGEVLSLYAKLIWELQRDENRAASYFDQAIQASPNDSAILGSYALFLWESEADE